MQPPASDWELCAAGAAEFVRRVPTAPADGGPLYFTVRGDGSLRALAGAPALPGETAWRQCCVVGCSTGHVLVGPWEGVVVDPTVWGWERSDESLCTFTVRAATQRRVQLRARQRCGAWYLPGAGCRPALFPLPAGAPGPSCAATGLQALELRWASSHEARQAEQRRPRRRAAEFEVELLPCQQPGLRRRLCVHERLAVRREQEQAPPVPGPAPPPPPYPLQDDVLDAAKVPPPASPAEEAERQAVRAVWHTLRAADLPREHYALAVRLLHGSLYVGGFLCHIRVLPPAAACCPHPACAAEAAPPLDSLSHAFLSCPAVASAADWVCRVFAAVSGGAPPPPCPRVMLAGEASVWAPPEGLSHLWTHLRLAFLHAVWQLRGRRSLAGAAFDAVAVCGATVAAVRAAMRRDWTRATHDMRRLHGTYAEHFRGRDTSLQVGEFVRRWARGGVLCAVDGGAMTLRFSLGVPVAAPAAGPVHAAGAAGGGDAPLA